MSDPDFKILVAEDDLFLRELSVKKLRKSGYNVVEALDGIEALDKIIKEKPSIVLLDIIMPGLEGFEVLKRIRAHNDPEVNHIPIIILSNLGQDDDVKKGLEYGATDYLIKANFTIDDIIERIKKYTPEAGA